MKIVLFACFLLSSLTACLPVSTGGSNSFKSVSRSVVPAPSIRPPVNTAVSARYPSLANSRSDFAAQAEYKIGFSDLLDIKVFDAEELTLRARVDGRGFISMPLLGAVLSAGLSPRQLERRLEGMLRKDLLQNPKVTVFVEEYTAQRVTVEGEVKNPGVFPIKGNVSVLQAVAMAGGLAEFAVPDGVVVFRKDGSNVRGYSVNLAAIRNGQQADPLIQNEDRIVVSRLEQRVTLEGEVVKPSIYPYKDKVTVLQAIALGGGLTALGAPDKIVLFRRMGGIEKAYGIDLNDIRSGKIVDPYIAHDDRIVVHRSNSRYWLKQATSLLSPLTLLNGLI
jgi:polysaccharide export outer membrane protein